MTEIFFQCRPPTVDEREQTAQHLREHTEAAIGMTVNHVPFGLLAHDANRLVGSLIGKIFFNWLHIDLIWVDEAHHGKGIGGRLMGIAEEQANVLGLDGIEVWTQSWQAPGFYRKLGYEEFAVIDDFSPGHKRYAFRRHLKEPGGR